MPISAFLFNFAHSKCSTKTTDVQEILSPYPAARQQGIFHPLLCLGSCPCGFRDDKGASCPNARSIKWCHGLSPYDRYTCSGAWRSDGCQCILCAFLPGTRYQCAIDTTLIHPNALPHWQGWQVDTGPFDIFSSSHEVMGLMGNRTATVGIGGEWGRLYYSSYATMGKYDSAFLGHYNTFSIGGILKLGVTPRLNIGVSGQYTPTAVKSRLLYPYTPTSHYSVMFEFKATKKLWIGFEVGRSFNPVNKSWHSFGGPTYR